MARVLVLGPTGDQDHPLTKTELTPESVCWRLNTTCLNHQRRLDIGLLPQGPVQINEVSALCHHQRRGHSLNAFANA